MPRDRIFDTPMPGVAPFEFNSEVARVFDDMADRSIPWYRQVEQMSASLSAEFYQAGSILYDLGCSTATGTILAAEALKAKGFDSVSLVGVDNSPAMCQWAREKLEEMYGESSPVVIRNESIEDTSLDKASVILMNYTLQFVSPLKREALVRKIYESLEHNGILIVSDKTTQSHTDMSRIFIDKYYDFKRANGYSELEISQKREALENVLIPYSVQEEETLFSDTGFASVDRFFCWYNFSSFICLKR
ncbi:carboxy-S-adenosyl-L-methionine synthase CmoA [Marispirochaeta aestuarii]|uniref:carboxy-S-adenosyl-L-methionine synthase CmoA n=1 Tax=Marispirochaeta aestuarii TaxID=1963862 RepID=UPI002ABE50FC|nr:carboxy-S-adenosyl-L-methionine synthase CmoA [Marispirochaeta aestuarii]